MEEDLSRRTITVLVVLTLIISLLGTLSVMSAVNELRLQKGGKAATQGYVKLEVLPHQAKAEAPPSRATGEVVLQVLPHKPEKPRILLLPEK